jgi:ABC-type Zn uptake system ZnuABC Zn-binding protein ZnuA
MKRLVFLVGVAAALLGAVTAGAASRLRVIATIPDLRSLTEAVGGTLVEVDSLTRGNQNFHDAEVRPSMMLKLRKADLLVENGLELDAWIDVAVQGANNASIVRGGRGRVEAGRGVPVLEVPTARVDRSMGDVHPRGNPHFSLDPGAAPTITGNVLEALARLAPDQRAAFERNRNGFLVRLEAELARWTKVLEPHRGAKVVVYHPVFIYFLTRFGLVQLAAVEDRPGIPPSPQHLATLIRSMKEQGVKVVLVEPWSDQKLASRVAQEAGARAVVMATSVGAAPGTDDYIAMIDFNVRTLAEALR